MDIAHAVSITIGVVQIIKLLIINTEKYDTYKNYVPLLSLVLGSVIGYFSGVRGVELVIVGLIASGTYDAAKMTAKEVNKIIP